MTIRRVLLLLSLPVVAAACSAPTEPPPSLLPMNWQPIDSLNAELPRGITVYGGRNDSLPLNAWAVRIHESDPAIRTRVVASDDVDGKETVTEFGTGACIAVNAGYFQMAAMPAEHAGLLLVDDSVLAPSTLSTVRDSVRYLLARSAIGFYVDGSVDVAWVTSSGDTVLALDAPVPNRPGQPAASVEHGVPWHVVDAVAAGPALVMGDSVRITSDEEGFFGTSIPDVHPRTAAGYTEDGDLILMVVDGRQETSRGVSLEELATLMIEFGAVEALNLDGGGSSALAVRGRLVNRPAGDTVQRQVMSALVTTCDGRD